MVAKLVLDEISSSGAGITIDSSKTFTVNGSLLTSGATQVTASSLATISVDNTGTPTVNISGKSNSLIVVSASSNSSVVTLPPVANFSTCGISVVSSDAHGAGYKIEIKDNGGTELYTLYHKGDHCEFVSDGSTVYRTGNEFATVRGGIFLTTGVAAAGSTVTDIWDVAGSANYTVTQVGGGWSTATDDFNAPHAGLYYFGGYYAGTTGQYNMGWNYHDGSAFITDNSSRHAPNGVSTDGIMRNMAAADKLIWYGSNHSSATTALGAASGGARCSSYFYMIRRY